MQFSHQFFAYAFLPFCTRASFAIGTATCNFFQTGVNTLAGRSAIYVVWKCKSGSLPASPHIYETVRLGQICGNPCHHLLPDQHPQADDFADILEFIFLGPVDKVPRPTQMFEKQFTLQELRWAISRLNRNKAPDSVGVTAETCFFTIFGNAYWVCIMLCCPRCGATILEGNIFYMLPKITARCPIVRFPAGCKHKVILQSLCACALVRMEDVFAKKVVARSTRWEPADMGLKIQ